jgi:REP element-mobilizing transposase RayT
MGAMKYDPEKHHRRSIRLKEYDYAQHGAYFITLCTHQRQCTFGQVVEGEMQLNAIGLWIQACWQKLPLHFPSLTLDTWVIMPNHLHGILCLDPNPNHPRRGDAFGNMSMRSPQDSISNASPSTDLRSPQDSISNASPSQPHGTTASSIGAVIQNFKSISTRKTNKLKNTPRQPLWQRNYYEHIIRNDDALKSIQHYICNNPLTWEIDQLHPNHRIRSIDSSCDRSFFPEVENCRDCTSSTGEWL